jgi:hypothetical protein
MALLYKRTQAGIEVPCSEETKLNKPLDSMSIDGQEDKRKWPV